MPSFDVPFAIIKNLSDVQTKEECNKHHNNLDFSSTSSYSLGIQNEMLGNDGSSIEKLKVKLKFSEESNQSKNNSLPMKRLFGSSNRINEHLFEK